VLYRVTFLTRLVGGPVRQGRRGGGDDPSPAPRRVRLGAVLFRRTVFAAAGTRVDGRDHPLPRHLPGDPPGARRAASKTRSGRSPRRGPARVVAPQAPDDLPVDAVPQPSDRAAIRQSPEDLAHHHRADDVGEWRNDPSRKGGDRRSPVAEGSRHCSAGKAGPSRPGRAGSRRPPPRGAGDLGSISAP